MNRKLANVITTGLLATAGYLIYWAGRNAEFDEMVNRVKKSEHNEIYTYLPNGDYVTVIYRENRPDI